MDAIYNIKRENIFQDHPHHTSGVGVNKSLFLCKSLLAAGAQIRSEAKRIIFEFHQSTFSTLDYLIDEQAQISAKSVKFIKH